MCEQGVAYAASGVDDVVRRRRNGRGDPVGQLGEPVLLIGDVTSVAAVDTPWP